MEIICISDHEMFDFEIWTNNSPGPIHVFSKTARFTHGFTRGFAKYHSVQYRAISTEISKCATEGKISAEKPRIIA
jgi:hypothetical protein